MSRRRIIGFCGSSWRPARSRALVEAVGADLRERYAITIDILDLVDAGPGLAAFSRDGLSGSFRVTPFCSNASSEASNAAKETR